MCTNVQIISMVHIRIKSAIKLFIDQLLEWYHIIVLSHKLL